MMQFWIFDFRFWTGGARHACAAIVASCVLTLVLSEPAASQQPAKIPVIGYLTTPSLSTNAARVAAFQQGLRELNYREGQNVAIEWRFADGKIDRLPRLAAELVRLNVDIIVSGGPPATRAAKQAGARMPIVMTFDNDPVGNGFVTSLARPGRNITGLSTLAPEISSKQLELLKEIVPNLSRVAILGISSNPGNAQALKEVELAAGALKIQLHYLDVIDYPSIETAFQIAARERVGAALMLASPLLVSQRSQIVDLALRKRLPVMYWRSDIVDAGGLVTYSVSITDLDRRAARYVDRIFKGAKPADLPIEQPTQFELVINLKTAKQIGLNIPPHILARADRVIR